RDEVRRAIVVSGGVPLSIRLPRPAGLGVEAVIRTDRPAWYLKNRLRGVLVPLETRWDIEGSFVAVVDHRGRLVGEWAGARRSSSGAGGARAPYAGCSPMEDFGIQRRPACPA